ncbi:adenylate/guanylate cyclase domain-containing protein [Conexibacter sp. JD483]|uniref:CHASE2 domain-containing protein n=1 Tax=unclassified Conexibacter TaxID=2627773 RepID=UPI002717091F|nr:MULTISPECIES: adenylate/guanylate cyclase domain-containing protein [unclassified Conexibacter]MDO8184868.1 adenylate/guanylate cyclase domain-containing protein [Conexibacter sp. CPCC 205706]MDO8196643.1 adenylate/guanylate cyclase domain-containing protein [Conexibacter sp. CPCC 205762]MDR9371028.1 adenylate/guanylate cyclase domain-containing protein [Conexibacter sp. JD483]
MLSRPVRALITGLLAAALAAGIAWTGALQQLESASVDERFRVRGSQGPPAGVSIVEIDDDAIRDLGIRFPFPRRLHAQAIDALLAAGARAVAYDVQFTEASDPADDAALARAAADPRVVLGTSEIGLDGRARILPRLRQAGARVGVAFFPVDTDGTWRRFAGSNHGVPHLSALAADGSPDAPERPIDFAGPQDTVAHLSFSDLLDGRFDRDLVRGRIVLVGATAPSLLDFHPTPYGHEMSGVEINANAVQTILDGYPLRDAPPAVAVLLVLACGLLAPLATALPGSPSRALVRAFAVGASGVVVLLGGAQLAFDGGAIVPLVAPLLALLFGTAGAVALTYAVELRAQRRLRVELERFVAPAVATELLARDEPLESRRVVGTVLFCDLRGFTTLSERLGAERTIALLNRYLELVTAAVLDRGGTVVSYQGDGVMAVFGAPLPLADHAARAVAAGFALVDDVLPALNRWASERGLLEQDALLGIGVGLNSGELMAGVIGSERRVEYAAIGDVTNVAARLQALGRELALEPPARLFAAEATVKALGGAEAAERLERHGEVGLKGRRVPVAVWVGR